MAVLKLIASLISLAIAGLGILGIAEPAALLEFGRSLLAPPALYAVAAVRILFGALLIFVAGQSQTPRTLRVIGVFIVVAGLLTPLFGPERSAEGFSWLSSQGLNFIRTVAALPVVFGIFLVYAINARLRR
ncbi:MAG: hypothetical protein ABI580_02265 [Burkholderiaceae bacterium]